MDDGLIIVLDYDKICRLCLQTKGVMSDIFVKDDEVPLTMQIKLVTSVEICVTDSLPGKICHKCRYVVELSYELRSTVLKSNQLLCDSSHMDVDTISQALGDYKQQEDPDQLGPEDWQPDERGYASEEGEGGDEELTDAEEEDNWRAVLRKKRSRDYEFDELTCQLCLEVLHGITAHLQHVEQHYSGHPTLVPFHRCCKPFSCALCPDLTFSFRKDLIVHHRGHLDIHPYFCQVPACGCYFKSKEALRHHMYSHADKKFVCEKCGAAFRRKFELGQHRVRHLDEGARYTCAQCRVVCKNRLSFKAHMRHHETGRRFKCPRSGCPKAFFSNTDLSIHERAHSNDKCFKCPLCVCAYISQSQLNRHLRQHEKRRVNKCDKCSQSFSDYTEFCNHRIKTHGEWHPHKCPACNQGYQGVRQLERHVARCRLLLAASQDLPLHSHSDVGAMFKAELDSLQAEVGLHAEALEVVLPSEELQGDAEAGNFLYMEAADLLGEGEGGAQYMVIKGGRQEHFFSQVEDASIKEERL